MPVETDIPDDELERAIRGTRTLLLDLLTTRAVRAAKVGIYYCTACKTNLVTPADGQDTCPECVQRLYGVKP